MAARRVWLMRSRRGLARCWQTIAGDQAWVFGLLKAGVKMGVLPEPVSVFTFTGANLSYSAAAVDEKFGWLPTEERPNRWLTPLVVLSHRVRKLLAGAYRTRDVQ